MDFMVNSVLGWVILGLIVGACAWLLVPDPSGWVGSLVVAVIGSVVGGLIAYALRVGADPYSPAGWIMSVMGAALALATYHSTAGIRRPV
jgi:uncharacterized membrane protein YeaQ/YmgE (transglycosylase-associated protein family)